MIQPIRELYRTIQPPFVYGGINLNEWELVGYLQGSRIVKCTGLTVYDFDSIQEIRQCTNVKKEKPLYLHAIACRKGWQDRTIVLKTKTK